MREGVGNYRKILDRKCIYEEVLSCRISRFTLAAGILDLCRRTNCGKLPSNRKSLGIRFDPKSLPFVRSRTLDARPPHAGSAVNLRLFQKTFSGTYTISNGLI